MGYWVEGRCGGLATRAPKVWMDAYLAAFAIAGDLEFLTLDRDFTQFTRHGLRLTLLGQRPADAPPPKR